MAAPKVLGCPFTKLDSTCVPELCAICLSDSTGQHKCAIALLAENGRWSAPAIKTLGDIRRERS